MIIIMINCETCLTYHRFHIHAQSAKPRYENKSRFHSRYIESDSVLKAQEFVIAFIMLSLFNLKYDFLLFVLHIRFHGFNNTLLIYVC